MKDRLSIDIRGRMIKFVEGSFAGENSVNIKKIAYLDVKEAVHEYERFTNCDENANLIKNFLAKHKFTAKKVLLSISDAKVITRVISIPKLSRNDVRDLINIEIPKYFPIDLSRFYIDYRILNTYNDRDKIFYKVLLCAIPSEIVREYVDIFLACDLKPVLVDVHPNSVSRLFQNIEFEDIAIIDGGVDIADLLILERGAFSSYITFSFEIPEFTELYRNPSEYDITQIEDKIEKLIKNMQNYFDFYLSTHEGKNIDKLYITGDLALIKGVQERLYEEFKIETFTGFDKLEEVIKQKKNADMNENCINGNIGLLLRGV